MAEHRGLVGGFAASNSGEIEDCYCIIRFNGKNYTSGGFVGENKGTISKSFCEHAAKGLSGGFSGNHTKLGSGCYFVHDLESDDKQLEQLWDRRIGLEADKVKNPDDASKIGYDMQTVWSYTGQKPLLRFQENNWVVPDAFRGNSSKEVLTIRDAKNLFLFAEMVNSGDNRFLHAKVRLDTDIDLDGKTWTPIGTDRSVAFEGVFDGNGHSVENFVIKGDGISRKGFFGYLKGSVYNLTIDCEIRGEGYIGGIAAVNEGTIGCCGATVGLYGKGSDVSAGGLVSINSGHIFRSFAAGKIKFLMIPIIPIAAIACSGVVLSAAALASSSRGGSVYSPIDSDPNQQPATETVSNTDFETSSEKTTETGEDTPPQLAHSLNFTLNETVYVYTSTRDCILNFVNPSGNTNNLVLELSIEDADGNRTVIAKSGAILPGYRLQSMTLNEDVQLDAGSYSGYITLCPYDTSTNNKSMVETELPVSLVVSD
jgi:hypothetical protein